MADSFVDAVNNKARGGNAIVPEAMDLLKTFESFKPTSYYDLDNKKKRGTLTVGYGFTKNDIPELREGYSMDKATAERLLPDLVKTKYGSTVREKVKVPLTDQQYSALSSFAYNVGPTNFSSSTLVKKLNAGDYEGAASEFKKWNKAGGKELEGLSRRRAAEAALFKGDTMELGKILEKQKFGGGQPKKKGGVAEAGDSFINAMSQADLAKAVSAPIGEGGSPDNPPEYLTPDNSRLMLPSYPPKFQNITTGEITSEALTPLPDSPEEAGTKAVEQVVKDVEVKKEKPASAMEEMVKAFAKPEKKEEPAKEEKATESPMKGVYFNSPTLGTVVSGLKRKAGLGAK
jgi:GH24 family phage-related lysozyme (muramidase)